MSLASIRRPARAFAVLVSLLAVASLIGCGSSTDQPPGAGGAANGNQVAGAAVPKLAPDALVKKVALVKADFTDGTKVKLIQDGDVVAGQVTLDNCGALFTTEAHRTARHQTVMVSAKKRAYGFSNEVVAYDTTQRAAAALEELRQSIAHCPKKIFIPSKVQGVPDTRNDVNKLSTFAGLPVKDTAVQTLVLSAHGTTQHFYGMAIYQRQGTVLDIVYLQSMKKLPPEAVKKLRSLALLTGKRLAAT